MIETLNVWAADEAELPELVSILLSPEDWFGGSLFEPYGLGWLTVTICPN